MMLLKDERTQDAGGGLSGRPSRAPVAGAFARFVLVAAAVIYGLSGGLAWADADVPLDSWVYRELDRLQAAGLVESGSLSSRPISRREAARLTAEARQLSKEKDEGRYEAAIARLEKEFAAELEDFETGRRTSYLRPLDEVRARGLYLDGRIDPARSQETLNFYESLVRTPHPDNLVAPPNDQGRERHDGANARADASSLFQWGPISGYARIEGWRLPSDDVENTETGGEVESGYLKLNLGKWYVLAGREPLWWGPGRHGSLLLSNNAKPFDQIRVGNDQPVLLPWIFDRLGPVHLEAFATRLEEDRDVSEPFLSGARITVLPFPWLELGASRAAMFGGRGWPVDIHTIGDAITADGENSPGEAGNQLASVDARLTIPWKVQPFQLYGELGGDDMLARWFSRDAYLVGFHLPRIGPFADLDLRAEYYDSYRHPWKWYTHHRYTSGYTYEGQFIGHHAGTDSRDAYLELGWSPIDALRLWTSADFERHNLFREHPERQEELTLGAHWWPLERLRIEASVARVQIDNAGFEAGEEAEAHWVGLSAAWRF